MSIESNRHLLVDPAVLSDGLRRKHSCKTMLNNQPPADLLRLNVNSIDQYQSATQRRYAGL